MSLARHSTLWCGHYVLHLNQYPDMAAPTFRENPEEDPLRLVLEYQETQNRPADIDMELCTGVPPPMQMEQSAGMILDSRLQTSNQSSKVLHSQIARGGERKRMENPRGLPNELILQIFDSLPCRDIVCSRQVCRLFNTLARSDALWYERVTL